MYAIFRSGDKQFRAETGMTVKVPTLPNEAGDKIVFDQVLLTGGDNGIKIGAPLLSGATVTGEVLGQGKEKKVVIFKWKRRKNYRLKKGHRTKFTAVRITDISIG